jgi:hypothetical protein
MYLHARYYDPQLGIFLSPDRLHPKTRGVGTNRFAYAAGNPINATDRSGHCLMYQAPQGYLAHPSWDPNVEIPADYLMNCPQIQMPNIGPDLTPLQEPSNPPAPPPPTSTLPGSPVPQGSPVPTGPRPGGGQQQGGSGTRAGDTSGCAGEGCDTSGDDDDGGASGGQANSPQPCTFSTKVLYNVELLHDSTLAGLAHVWHYSEAAVGTGVLVVGTASLSAGLHAGNVFAIEAGVGLASSAATMVPGLIATMAAVEVGFWAGATVDATISVLDGSCQ